MKISSLKINNANPRSIKDSKFKKLCSSIKDFPKMMSLRPIVIDNDGTILGGNMRYRALCELGYKEIPDEWVKRADELTDEEKQRFIIEDNVAFGDWDYDLLANAWDTELLNDWGVDLWNPQTDSIGSLGTENNFMTTQTAFEEGDVNLPEELQGVDLTPADLPKLQGTDEVEMERVIIVFKKEQSQKLANILGLESIDKVVYNLDELTK